MKKLLLILLCVSLIFSCKQKKAESNKENSHNTETANSRIEEDKKVDSF